MSWINSPKLLPIRPYLKIMRLDNLTGTFLLLWPCLLSIGLAWENEFPYITLILFLVGALIMRSAGCVINDLIDRKIDAKVERTKNRPLSSGTLKIHEAVLLLFILLVAGWTILVNLSPTAMMLGYIIVIPIFIYPIMKRFTYWPQIFLAFTINWGALMGWAAVRDEISLIPLMLYAACIFWTLGYDTIYAHQDKDDDILLGIKSSAIRLGKATKRYLYIFYGVTIALLWLIGIIEGAGVLYYAFLMMGAVQLFWQVNTLNINNSDSCMRRFSSNRYFGLFLLLGIFGGKVLF